MKNVFFKNFSKLHRSNSGYVAIILAVFLPLALSLFYLYVSYSSIDSAKTQTNIATRDAALAVANNYSTYLNYSDSNKNFDIQKSFLARKAALTFNATLKSNFGLSNNALALRKENVSYSLDKYGWVETSFKEVGSRGKTIAEDYSSYYDPDYERILSVIPGKGAYLKKTRNSGDKILDKYIPIDSPTSYIKLEYSGDSKDGLPKVKVTSSVILNTKGNSLKNQKTQYTASYYAEPAQCKADIVVAIPTNKAAFTVLNDINDDVIGYGNSKKIDDYINTPIYEINNALRIFVKRFMFFDGLRMGIIPYSGKISVDIGNFSEDLSYLLADWPDFIQPEGTNPTIPIYDSYKTCGISGESINNIEEKDIAYFGKWNTEEVGNGLISQENILDDPSVLNKFRKHPTQICYGGNISTYSMRCKVGSKFFPNPYTVLPLGYDIFKIYRYLNIIAPFDLTYLDGEDIVKDGNLSNFLFLPFLWGDYLLFQKWSGGLNSTEKRKKILVIFSNMSDFFAPGELTYLGFDNDASYIPTIEGERLDFDNNINNVCLFGKNQTPNELNEDSSLKNYIKNSAISIYGYRGEYEENGNHVLLIPEAQNCRLAIKAKMTIKLITDSEHSLATLSSVKLRDSLDNIKVDSIESDKDIEVSDNDSLIINYKNDFRDSPIIAKFDVYGIKLELDYSYSGTHQILSDGRYIYICKENAKNNSSSIGSVRLKVVKSKENDKVVYGRLSYVSDGECSYILCNKNNHLVSSSVSLSGVQYKYHGCVKKYNAKVRYFAKYKNYIRRYGVRDAYEYTQGITEHCCSDDMPSRGFVKLKKHYPNITKISYSLYGRKITKLCGDSTSPRKIKLFVSDNYESNDCKKKWYWHDAWSDENFFGEISGLSTSEKKYQYLGRYSVTNNAGKSGQYITFEAAWTSQRGSAYINDVVIDYLDEISGSGEAYCSDVNCGNSIISHMNFYDAQISGVTDLEIYAEREDNSEVSFSYSSSISLRSEGNGLIVDNGVRVDSVNISGCQAFFIDKSWLEQGVGLQRIRIGLRNCRILSIDVSNNIMCFKSRENSHFLCVENNLDKIVVELDFNKGNAPFKYPEMATGRDIMIQLGTSNGTLEYDIDQMAYVPWKDNQTFATCKYEIDSGICDLEQGKVTFSVAPVDKWIRHGSGDKKVIASDDFGEVKINYNGRDNFHEDKSSKIKFSDYPGDFIISGAKITGYEISNYSCDLGVLGCMPSFHVRVWKPSVYWNSCTQKAVNSYPKGLAASLGKYLDSSRFNYSVFMRKNHLLWCLTKNHVWIEDPRNGEEVCTLYGYIAYCDYNEKHYGTGRLGYPCFFANRYSGGKNQNPRYQYDITGGWTEGTGNSYLLCENNPLNPGLVAEGSGRLRVKLFIDEPFLMVNGVKTTVRESTSYTCLLKDNKNSQKNVLNDIKINCLKLLSIKYEGRNPIMYDRPLEPSKNARWIDFSSTVRGGKGIEPGRDKGIYNSFSGEEANNYEEIYKAAKENYRIKKKNLQALGIKICEGISMNAGIEVYKDDDEDGGISEGEGEDCYDCRVNGWGDPCSLIKTDEVVCSGSEKTYSKWKEAKRRYAEAYKNYAESFGRLMGLSVRENPSWDIDMDPVVGNELKDFSGENYNCSSDDDGVSGSGSSKDVKKGYIEYFESDSELYNAYYRYNKARVYYEKLANSHCPDNYDVSSRGSGCDVIPPDSSNLPYTERDLPSYCIKCRSGSASSRVNHLDLEACYEQMEEQISRFKLEYYRRLGLNVNLVEGAEAKLTLAEEVLDNYLKKGNGVYLDYYDTSVPTLEYDVIGKMANEVSPSKETAVDKWLIPGLVRKEVEYESLVYKRDEVSKYKRMLNLLGYKYNCGDSVEKSFFTYLVKVWCYRISSESSSVENGPYIYPADIDNGDSRFLRNVFPAWELVRKGDSEYVFRNSKKGELYYDSSCSGDGLDDNYYVGSVICANKNNPIKSVSTGSGEEKLPEAFAPEGYLNPCMKRSSGDDVLCSNMCKGEVKRLNDDIGVAEEALSQAEQVLEEEYNALSKEVEELKLVMDEAYDEFIRNGVLLEVEAYDNDGNATKYFASCADGEDNPETRIYQKEAVVCSDKCQKKKQQFSEALEEYKDALAAYKSAKENKNRYEHLDVVQSDELVYENSYFRTNKEDALLALYLLRDTGDLSLVLENFYNQDRNVVSMAASYDAKKGKFFTQLTGRSSIFNRYDTRDTLDLEDVIKASDTSLYDTLTGYVVKVKGSGEVNAGKTRLVLAEFTNPINMILSSSIWGSAAQRVEGSSIFDRHVNITPTNMLKQTVLPKIIEKIKSRFDKDYGRIYFINYRLKDGEDYIKDYADSKLKVFSADTPEELNKILMKISQEIEEFAGASSAKVYAE